MALASWTKLAALIVVPLWASYPGVQPRRQLWRFAAAFTGTTLLSFWALFLSGDPLHDIRVFYERTFQIQFDRSSPFSLRDWGQYHATGLPDLKWLQRVLQVASVVGALAVAVVPRRKIAATARRVHRGAHHGIRIPFDTLGSAVHWLVPAVPPSYHRGRPLSASATRRRSERPASAANV